MTDFLEISKGKFSHSEVAIFLLTLQYYKIFLKNILYVKIVDDEEL